MGTWSLFADWHTHTCYSDGQGTISENARAGQQRGLQQVAITDHGPASLGLGLAGQALAGMRSEIALWNNLGQQPHLLLGAETNVISQRGDLDLSPKQLEGLDLVIASLHPLVKPLTWQDGVQMLLPNLVERYTGLASRRLRNVNTKTLIEAVNRNRIDFIAHPGLWIDIDTVELAVACAKRNTALEINCRHADMLSDYVQAAMPTGVDFVINSDAHRPEQVGVLAAGKRLAQRLQLAPQRIRNAIVKG